MTVYPLVTEKIRAYLKSEITYLVNLHTPGLPHLSLPPREGLDLTIKEQLNGYP
jgi:hypothetical protein